MKNAIQIFADYKANSIYKNAEKALVHQDQTLQRLLQSAANTQFGKAHGFSSVQSYNDFINAVPLNSYTTLQPYIEKIMDGNKNVLWPGLPLYIGKTSGTTGDYKYIPISKENMKEHVRAAKKMLFCYIHHSKDTTFLKGKFLSLQGSPKLETSNGLKIGRLSGIAAHYVPFFLRHKTLPPLAVNCIADWNKKVNEIAKLTKNKDVRLINGIPSWLMHCLEEILEENKKEKLIEVFPNLSLLIHGGINFEPYRKKFELLVGTELTTLETYPATEAFIAFQDNYKEDALLLNTNAGIFYEFIDMNVFHSSNAKRIRLHDVELNTNYALVLSTNSGLFSYVIGDTIMFVSKNPYKIKVTGRIKEYLSPFGEQTYAHQTDAALNSAIQNEFCIVNEYHVFPSVSSDKTPSYHHWIIEFNTPPADLNNFERKLNEYMMKNNIYYRDLILAKVISPLKITCVPKNRFYTVMENSGKLGEQNKVPKLSATDAFGKKLLNTN